MHLCAVITIILWSLANVLTRSAVGYYSPEGMAFLRYFIAAVTLLLYACLKKMRFPARKDVPLFFLGGAIGFALHVYAFNIGAQTVSASVISFVLNSIPVLTAVMAEILLKERLGLAGWLATVAAFGGVAVIAFSGGGFSLNIGIIWLLISALLLSAYNIFQRKLLIRYTALEVTTYCITTAAILLSVFSARSIPELLHAPFAQIFNIIFLGVFTSAIAYVCWGYALSIAEKTGDVANYMFFIPLLCIILGYFMLGEIPHAADFIGGAIIIASAFFVGMKDRIIASTFFAALKKRFANSNTD